MKKPLDGVKMLRGTGNSVVMMSDATYFLAAKEKLTEKTMSDIFDLLYYGGDTPEEKAVQVYCYLDKFFYDLESDLAEKYLSKK